MNEIQDAIDRLEKLKAKDSNGIRAEQLKNCSHDTKEKSGQSSTKLRSRMTSHQKADGKSESRSFTKKGDREDAGNYRPICSLPVLYKLFAAVQYARLAPGLHRIQPLDQAGSRPNHRCDDHFVLYRLLQQRCREWSLPLFISTIDFTKTFGRIKHSAFWSSLQRETTATALQPATTNNTDRHRERCISNQMGNEARLIHCHLNVQHSVAIFIGG